MFLICLFVFLHRSLSEASVPLRDAISVLLVFVASLVFDCCVFLSDVFALYCPAS